MILNRIRQWWAAQKLYRITAANRARISSPEYQKRSKASKLGHQRRRGMA